MKKNTYIHFEEESIIYIWSKFQLDTCMFDSNILLTNLVPDFGPGPGRWFRVLFLPHALWHLAGKWQMSRELVNSAEFRSFRSFIIYCRLVLQFCNEIEAFKVLILKTNMVLAPGADPEILKVGCTKFSGPELPCSRFDPFCNLL